MAAICNSCFWLAEIKKKNPLKLQGQRNCNFVGMMYGRSFIKYIHFMLIRHLTWPPKAILVSDWLKFYKSSAMKQQTQMNINFVGMMYQRFFTKYPHFVLSRGRHREFLFLIGWNFENLLLWNYNTEWIVVLQEWCMECPLQSFLISSCP